MKKEKLGILSSYDELCGIASYTKAVVDEFSKHYDVTVVPINGELLRKGEARVCKKHLEEICEKIKTFDCVNIQFEGGLFGSDPSKILRRSLLVARACKKLILTMHQIPPIEKYPSFKRIIDSILVGKIKPQFLELRNIYANNKQVRVYHGVISFCKSKNFPIIVHTPREGKFIKAKLNYDQVYDHPLSFHSQGYIKSIKANSSKDEFYKQFALDKNKIYLGIFGFIAQYKSHETLIEALEFLPEKYEVLIFGSQHPHSIKLQEKINPYIKKLMESINGKKYLIPRIKFCGTLNDADFLKALIWCDFNILPYLEVNQGGSGIAALSLEVGAKTIFSQNRAFIELAKYAPDSFKMFTIGNYIELAQAIQSYSLSSYLPHLEKYWSTYNVQTNMQLYHNLISKLLYGVGPRVQGNESQPLVSKDITT